MPYHQHGLPRPNYHLAVGLRHGPIKAGETKEFTFNIKVANKGAYTLICQVQTPGKWNVKEEPLTLNIN